MESKKLDLSFEMNGQTIPYGIWSKSDTTKVKTIVFLGTVQIGKIPGWVVQACPPNTVVIQGAPHWLANPDGSNLTKFMQSFSEEAFKSVCKIYSVQKVNIVTDSQAVPGVLHFIQKSQYGKVVDSIALLQPLGFNTSLFGNSSSDRMTEFRRRVNKNFKHQIVPMLLDSRLLYNHKQIIRKVGYKGGKTELQYDAGLSYDAISDLKKVSLTHKKIIIICGSDDKLFPPEEIQASLHTAQIDIPIKILQNLPHSPLATRLGKRLLQEAFMYQEGNNE